jgi:uncharacterized membrane protein
MGATLEHLSYYISGSAKQKLLSNPIITGFPIYGVGALFIYWLVRVLGISSVGGIFAVGSIVGTLMEYFVGRFVVKAGKYSGVSPEESKRAVNSWDYRGEPLNIDGIISAKHIIAWGALSVGITKLTPILKKGVTAALTTTY